MGVTRPRVRVGSEEVGGVSEKRMQREPVGLKVLLAYRPFRKERELKVETVRSGCLPEAPATDAALTVC